MLSTLTMNETEMVVKRLHRNDIFGCQGILMSERKHYMRPYFVVARKDTYLAAFTKSSYQRIQERIYKKYVNQEINFLRNVE
jgi:CRP-like cAMP-binding protein